MRRTLREKYPRAQWEDEEQRGRVELLAKGRVWMLADRAWRQRAEISDRAWEGWVSENWHRMDPWKQLQTRAVAFLVEREQRRFGYRS